VTTPLRAPLPAGVAVVVLLVALVLLLAPPASATSYRATSSDVTLWTGSARSQPGASVTLGRIGVHSSGPFEVRSTLVVEHLSSDPVDLVSVSLGCQDKTGRRQRVGHYMNTLAAARVTTFSPRLVMHAQGDFSCWVSARAMRIRPGSSTAPQPVRIRSSELTVTKTHTRARATAMHAATDPSAYLGRSQLVRAGTSSVATSTSTVLPRTDVSQTVEVGSQLQLTSCAHRAGSGDETTGGRQLCETPGAWVHTVAGPLVTTQTFVRQMTPSGGVCRTVEVPGSSTRQRLSADRHHAPRYSGGTVTLPPMAGCGSELRAFTRVSVPKGDAGLVVHWPGTAVTLTPRA
jgi:hypothetical protein